MQRMRRFGPGLVVTAAFIGPGTITTASVAGAHFGFSLPWAIVFAVVATLVLQEMSARLGLISGQGLAEALRSTFNQPVLGGVATALVIVAIGFGNAAYEAGNILGAAMGLEVLSGLPRSLWALMVAAGGAWVLAAGAYRFIERFLTLLVGLMGLVFLLTMLLVRPDVETMMAGVLIPTIEPGALVTVIALIGTTVVPYNLFLHASSVREKWPDVIPRERALSEARWDALLAISIGGAITMAITATAAAAFFESGVEIRNAGVMATQLEPLLGQGATWVFSMGLLAAGLSSTVTAPLAAAYAITGVMGWKGGLPDRGFRAVWITIVAVGAALAVTGTRPVAAILLAQAANGLMLPACAVFLLLVMNRGDLLGKYKNGPTANILGWTIVSLVASMGVFHLANALDCAR